MLHRHSYIGPHIFQAAAVATGNGTELIVAHPSEGTLGHLGLQVEGITTATVTWEATVDGTNWVAVGVTSMADNSTVATTATADGLFKIQVAGMYKFRARISAWTSGTINVTGFAVSVT